MLIIFLDILGFLYIIISFFSSILGFSISVMMRVEISVPFTVLGNSYYYVMVTSHAVIMVFYFLTSLATGVYYLLIPIYCRINSFYNEVVSIVSFIEYVLSFIVLVSSLFIGEGVNSG